jgi:hypothetical protein
MAILRSGMPGGLLFGMGWEWEMRRRVGILV